MARYRSTDEAYVRKMTVRVLDDVYEAFQTVARTKGLSLICDYLSAQDAREADEWLAGTGERHRHNLDRIRRLAWR